VKKVRNLLDANVGELTTEFILILNILFPGSGCPGGGTPPVFPPQFSFFGAIRQATFSVLTVVEVKSISLEKTNRVRWNVDRVC
jgi:hypothetical protein